MLRPLLKTPLPYVVLTVILSVSFASVAYAQTAVDAIAHKVATDVVAPSANETVQQCVEIIKSADFQDDDRENLPSPTSLDVCIYKALLENQLIKASRHNIAARREAVKQAKAVRFGKLSFNIYGSKYNDAISAFINKDQAAARNLNFDLPLYAGGSIKSAENQAKIASQIARHEAEQTRQEIAAQTIEAYLNLLQSQWLIAVSKEYIRQTDIQIKLIKDRIDAGSAVKSDLLRVEVARNNAKLNLITAKNFRKRAVTALNLVMAGPLHRDLAAQTPDKFEVKEEDLPKGIARAKTKRPELLGARSALNILKEELVTARAKLKPTIGFNAVYGDLNSTFIGDEDSAQLTVAGSFPLYEGGGIRADIHRAQNAIKEQKERLSFFEQQILHEVTQAHIDMTEARERMVVAIANISSSKENTRIVEERYKAGTAIVLELVDAHLGLLNSRTQVLDALIQYFIATSRYYRASGNVWNFFSIDMKNSLENTAKKVLITN